MNALELVKLTPLMQRTSGRADVVIALIDGPVLLEAAGLWSSNVRHLGNKLPATCARPTSGACMHGTFVAGILSAKRSSVAPAICPDCTLLVRAVFSEKTKGDGQMPSATPAELADAVIDAIKAGARVINLSLSLVEPSGRGQRELEAALSFATARGVIVVAAAGNQGEVGGSVLSRHPWPIPVAGCGGEGRPTGHSNLGSSIGRRGLLAPGENITSLGPDGKPTTFGGTSAAAPFVTGAVALLWSEFPAATATDVKLAVTGASGQARRGVVPPLLNAWAAYQAMAVAHRARMVS
jgi:subtilisin family serine protease